MKTSVIKQLSLTIMLVWLFLFALTPLIMMLFVSFLQTDSANLIVLKWTFSNFINFFQPAYFHIYLRSFSLASVCTLVTLLLAYPCAFILSKHLGKHKSLLLLLVIVPFWTSSLIRSYAILTLLKNKGLINSFLLSIHLIHKPMQLLYTNTAVVIAMVYNLLPFMILPLYNNIEKIDQRIFAAARDLGASRFRVLWGISLPLTLPGIVTGIIFVFLPAMTLFYIPTLLGGAKSILLGNLVKTQFVTLVDWPSGASTSLVLTAMVVLMLLVYRLAARRSTIKGGL